MVRRKADSAEDVARITKEWAKEKIQARIKKNRPRVRALIKYELFQAIYECPEMNSLRSGKLKWDFGLDYDPSMAISEAASNAFITRYKTDGAVNIFEFRIDIQPISFLNILSLPEAVQITEKGQELPWLEWLLTYGSTVAVIDGYGVKYNNGGRSGGAQMVKGYNFGRPFMVDPLYSGTPTDNFITRAISSHKDRIIEAAWTIVQI